MGIIRGGGFFIASLLFFVLISLGGILWTMSLSLDYNVVKPELSSVIITLVNENSNFSQIIDDKIPAIELHCQASPDDFVFQQGDYTIVIPCDVAQQGSNAIFEKSVNDMVDSIYYKKYECGFVQCFKESNGNPSFLVSEMSKNYLKNKVYLIFVISLILLALMFLLIESKSNLALSVGIFMLLNSLLFFKLEWMFSFFPDNFVLDIVSIFFTQSTTVFWAYFIAGILSLIIWVVLKFFSLGYTIQWAIGKIKGAENSNSSMQASAQSKQIPAKRGSSTGKSVSKKK